MGFESRRAIAVDHSPSDKVDQMRVYRAPGGAVQPGLQPDIEPLDDRIERPGAGSQAFENAGFALAAMGDKGANMCCGSVITGPCVGQYTTSRRASSLSSEAI